ncbi:hypothetical protein WA026_001037 [Henosepilachna vigintioctopunctata]|uniref:Queuosine 5'-phosphate N-glycosylase/hydrolase n=1 Tax=Henosepilachna vigintioctopunctata TaxID=420089 RepID=A0AAW1V0G8_9CUCU
MVLSCKKSGEYIASHSTHVKIKDEGIKKLGDTIVEEIKSGNFSTNFSQVDVHPSPEDSFALDWLLVADTLNFCFWHVEGEVGWCVEGYTGYFALCAAINKAVKNNPEFVNPKYYYNITEVELEKVLKSDNHVQIPLLPERVNCLREVGTILLNKYDGSFEKLVKEADGSAERLLNIIVSNFQCFRDEAVFKGERVALYKRAQILIGDIWSCFKNEGIGHFRDIEHITMFADYRVPQTLIYYGVLEYSEDLQKKLLSNTTLQNGSLEEVEIRGCSIQSVELLREYISKQLPSHQVNSIMLDHFLWDFRRKHAEEIVKLKIPFHKTFSIYY